MRIDPIERRGVKFILAALALLIMSLSATAALAEGTLDRIMREKKIHIGWIASPPLMMRDPATGDLKGYFFDAARYIFKEINVEPDFKEINFSTLVPALQSGQIYLSIASTFVTIKRAAVVDYTRPILYLGYSAVVRADDTRFKSLADFNQSGLKIAVLLGGSSEAYVRDNFPKAQILALNTNNQTAPFIEVASGRADVGINDAYSAHRFAVNQPSVKDLFAKEPYNVQPTAWTVRKGDAELVNFLNAAIETLLASGRLERMASHYPESGRYRQVLSLAPLAPK